MISQILRKKTLTLCMILLTLALQAQDRFGGLALYTVRDDMSKNAVETLKAVSDAGYAYVEAAGYNDGKFYGMEPKEFKKTLKQVGLKPVSTHQGFETLDNIDQMIADVKAAGFKYFVIPVPHWVILKVRKVKWE